MFRVHVILSTLYLDVFCRSYSEELYGEDLEGLEGEGVPRACDVRVTDVPEQYHKYWGKSQLKI